MTSRYWGEEAKDFVTTEQNWKLRERVKSFPKAFDVIYGRPFSQKSFQCLTKKNSLAVRNQRNAMDSNEMK